MGGELAAELAPNGILLLSGPMGAGKTVLTQGVAAGLGFEPDEIQSPSFSLIHEYNASGARLVHVDLYRVEAAEIEALGLEELLAGEGVKVVEWAEKLPFPVPDALRLRIEAGADSERRMQELTG